MTADSSLPKPYIAYILRSYPRLSQTFIVNEIWALEQLGLPIHIFAVTNPREPVVQPQVAQVDAPVTYLEAAQQQPRGQSIRQHLRLFWQNPFRYLKSFWYALRHAECDEGYTTISRFTCFHLAVHLAYLLHSQQQTSGKRCAHIHAHFAHDPTLIAQLTKELTGLSFTFTAHARDLYQISKSALTDRVAAAVAVVTCCGANLRYLQEVISPANHAKLRLIYHGVNLSHFQAVQPTIGRERSRPNLQIISVGRLVDKKGFSDLLQACALLHRRGYGFRCLIYGEGPLHDALSTQIDALDLPQVVQLMGACTQQELVKILPQSDLFVLTPFMTSDGDRDGIPNVLVEAMACGLAVVSTKVGGIPELIRDGENGLLAEPHAITAIADQLAMLFADELLRHQLGNAARQTVEELFDLQSGARQLVSLFRNAVHNENSALVNHESTTRVTSRPEFLTPTHIDS